MEKHRPLRSFWLDDALNVTGCNFLVSADHLAVDWSEVTCDECRRRGGKPPYRLSKEPDDGEG
jgi:hypothetical protein